MIFLNKNILCLPLLLLAAITVRAATFTVNTLTDNYDGTCDPTHCSLRDAINAASSNGQSDTIVFSVSGSISLDPSCVNVSLPDNQPLVIDGASSITLQANGTSAFCIYSNRVELKNLTVEGNTGVGEALVYAQGIQNLVLKSLTVQNNSNGGGVYLNQVDNVELRSSIIKGNGAAGVKVRESTSVTIGGLDSLLTPTPNQIYQNGQEGIVIEDSKLITVSYNYIGTDINSNGPTTDPPTSILPNQNSGVAIVSTTGSYSNNNLVAHNRIAYNKFENVLIKDPNTSFNEVRNNHIYSDFCLSSPTLPPNSGVVISNGTKQNIIRANRIECHKYTAVQVVGENTNNNEILDHDGSTFSIVGTSSLTSVMRKSDTVVLVLNDYNNGGFPTTTTSTPIPPGPSYTTIKNNIIEEGTYHGIHAILSTHVFIGNNTIRQNGANGILIVGSSGRIGVDEFDNPFPNTITQNGQTGIRVEPHYGSNTSYSNYSDDTNSVLTIKNNVINSNGLVGIFGVDNEADDGQSPLQLNTTNTIGPHLWVKVVQQWFGAVEVLNASNNPVNTITAGAIFSPTCNNTYQLQTYNGGAWGPTGFVLTDLTTWFYPPYNSLITDDFVDNSNNYVNCNPMTISVLAPSLYGTALFSFDGNSTTHPVTPDNGLPFSSSSISSKNARYQIAEVKLLGPSSADVIISGRVTDYRGRGLKRVIVRLEGGGLSSSLQTFTNSFGYYSFNVPAGYIYIIQPFSKKYIFKPSEHVINAQEDLQNVNFVGLENLGKGLTIK